MKKLVIFIMMLIVSVTLAGCNLTGTDSPIECPDGTKLVDGVCSDIEDDNTPTDPGTDPNETFVTKDVEIHFWHFYSNKQMEIIDEIIDDFENEYPMITVHHTSQGLYSGEVKNKVVNAFSAGQAPNLVSGDINDYIELYDNGFVIGLDGYINDSNFGVDISNFIPGFLDVNEVSGEYIGLPHAMFSEVVLYNKTIFDAHGITVPTNGSLTWDMLETYKDTLVGSGENQCEYLINFDHTQRLFIGNKDMYGKDNFQTYINDFKGYYDNKTLVTPSMWNERYASYKFQDETVCMIVTPPTGINYILPSNNEFETGITSLPQYDTNNKKVLTSGRSLALLITDDMEKEKATWLFMRYLLNDENMKKWATESGYLPITTTGSQEMLDVYNNTSASSTMYYAFNANKIILQDKDNFYTTYLTVPYYSELGDYFDAYLNGSQDKDSFLMQIGMKAPNEFN